MTAEGNEGRETWPWAAVFADDEEQPVRYFEADRRDALYPLLLFEGDGIHRITIRKITENAKGKLCIAEFCTDGEILPLIQENRQGAEQSAAGRLSLEFIGDSITCGFGNMVNDANRMFYSADENGWMAHPAVAARRLQADFSVVACSGIAMSAGIGNFDYGMASMKYYYPYRDRMLQELEEKVDEPVLWDFQKHIPDVIVLNLGTNDAAVIDLNADTHAGVEQFEKDYFEFLQLLRSYNGPSPWIICALGSLDYFLYDSIQRVAESFRRAYNDDRVSCFKYGRVRVSDGLGACRHPYVTTQVRMGEEQAAYIRSIL